MLIFHKDRSILPVNTVDYFELVVFAVTLWDSLRGRRLKGKGKGVLGARETRGEKREGRARREGGKRLPGNH